MVVVQIRDCAIAASLFASSGVSLRLAPDLYRIPDIAVFVSPPDDVPEKAPLIVVEILSKDDRYYALMEKLAEYRVWGVPNIWVVDPLAKRFAIYAEEWLENVSSLALADYGFELTPSILFSDL